MRIGAELKLLSCGFSGPSPAFPATPRRSLLDRARRGHEASPPARCRVIYGSPHSGIHRCGEPARRVRSVVGRFHGPVRPRYPWGWDRPGSLVKRHLKASGTSLAGNSTMARLTHRS
jgi:hypothetical protein